MIETNTWNRFRYTLWAPVYDLVGRWFDASRRASVDLLRLRAGQRVLIVGAGTGADLRFIPEGVTVVATDLTAAMLARARPRASGHRHLAVMDGHRLAVPDAAFDAVILHLILAVLPDPLRCLQETARVLRAGGRAAVFDKFVRRRPSLPVRAVNAVTRVLFTDVTRNLEDLLSRSAAPLQVEHDEPALLNGVFRRVVLRRTEAP